MDASSRGAHSRRLLRLSFGVLVVLFAAGFLVAMARTHVIRRETHGLVEGTLTSVELVSRLGRDLDQRRLLMDEHIFEHEMRDMERIERQLAVVETDYASASTAYERMAVSPLERPAWERLKQNVTALDEPIKEAIAYSRKNMDLLARQAMLRLDPNFAEIGRDLNALTRVNREAAERTVGEVQTLQRATTFLLGVLAGAGALLALAIGWYTTRLVQKREEQLQRYSDELETQNRDLDAFAGRVAHDLRGPLTAIDLASAQLAQRTPEASGTTTLLRRGVKRMEALIADLLSLSRINAEVRGKVCDPSAVATLVHDDLQVKVTAEGGTLRVAVEPARTRCAEGLLRQALTNLAENAVKYRRPEVPVAIEVVGRVDGDEYDLRVTDNAMGMSPEEVRQAFEPFYRALRSRDTPGTGIGLSIVKRVVEAAGGTISLQSQLGKGSTFAMRLPLARAGEGTTSKA
jgi:signal transduction histidine kinase